MPKNQPAGDHKRLCREPLSGSAQLRYNTVTEIPILAPGGEASATDFKEVLNEYWFSKEGDNAETL